MKARSFFFCILFSLSACTNTNITDTSAKVGEDAEPLAETICFQRLTGSANQDTSFVRMVISDGEVTGNFMHLPYEKDSRKGTITGTKQGDIIKGIWLYMQEGMHDTLSVEFKLNGNTLLQKNYSVNLETGRQFLSDTSRFEMGYRKIDCSRFPSHL